MLLPAPKTDDRTADKVIKESRALSPFYAAEWNSQATQGAGLALLQGFAQLLFDVIQHVNLTPEKNFVAFLDRLGAKLQPARPARAPVTFLLAPGTPENILIPSRTQAAAVATETRPEVVFETEQNLLATVAVLQAAYSARPSDDTICEHLSELKSQRSSQLFAGRNLQEHVFYLGHKGLLMIKNVAKVYLKITPPQPTTIQNLKDTNLVAWEYSLGKDEETMQEQWYPFTAVSSVDDSLILTKCIANQISAISINQIENRWIRCRAKSALSATSLLRGVTIDTVQLSVESFFTSGWIELPGGGQTPSGPAAVVFGGQLSVFVRGMDNGIYVNRLGADGSWSGWSEAPGGGQTPSDPAAVVFGGQLSVFVRGMDNGIYVNRLGADGSWSGWSEVPGAGQTLAGPTAVAVNNQIYLFVRGLNDGIWLNRRDAAGNWSGWSELPGAGLTPSGPTAVAVNNQIYLFVRGLNDGIWLNRRDAAGNWIGWSELPGDGRTPSRPGAVVVNGQISAFVRWTDNRIFINRFGADGTWSGWSELPGGGLTPSGPTSVVVSGQVYVFVREQGGLNGRIFLNTLPISLIDLAFFNDIPLNHASSIYPFGKQPRPFDTFYIASSDAFSKKDATVTLSFEVKIESTPGASAIPDPVFAWEYWNGTGWVILKVTMTGVDLFIVDGNSTVEFICPDDIATVSVNGQENFWIRARIVGGSYGTFIVNQSNNNKIEPDFKFPKVNSLNIAYQSQFGSPELCVTYNNLNYQDLTQNARTAGTLFQLFQPPEEDKPTFYLGFDKPLVSGPIGIYFSLFKQEYLEETKSRLQWQYWNGSVWVLLDALDDTDNLTRSGSLQLVGPADFADREKFGAQLFWIRAVDVDNRFQAPPQAVFAPPSLSPGFQKFLRLPGFLRFPVGPFSGISGIFASAESMTGEGPCPELLELFHPKFSIPAELSRIPPPPILEGVFLNTAWAIQAETIRDEILGSGDGQANQKFTLMRQPIVSEEIWVNEINVLLEEERKELLEQYPSQILEARDEKEKLTQVWVRWRPVEDFLDSTATSRHYAIDPVSGTIQFGDGAMGMIPPIGIDNIKATYQFGGGAKGNVGARKVISLKTSVAGVDKVTNPEPAGGGADTETLAKALERGPQVIKHRNHAIAREDFEWLARQASNSIAKVKCLQATNQNGEFETGWVAVIIAPHSQEAQPLPSAELIRQVNRYLADRCPNVVSVAEKLIVTGPAYVEVSVAADVFAASIDLISQVQSETIKSLKRFLHPLSGGPTGEGWDFGRLVCLSDIIAMLEALPNVDHVDHVTMQLRDTVTNTTRTVTDDVLFSGALPPYALIFSGEHNVTVKFQAQT